MYFMIRKNSSSYSYTLQQIIYHTKVSRTKIIDRALYQKPKIFDCDSFSRGSTLRSSGGGEGRA